MSAHTSPTHGVALRDRLQDVEQEIAELRDQRPGLVKARDEARERYVNGGGNPEFRAAEQARDALRAVEQDLEERQREQIGLLEQIGRGGAGARAGGGRGWQRVARELDLERGHTRVDLGLADLARLEPRASVSVTPSTGWTAPSIIAPFIPEARDERHLFMAFPGAPVEAKDMAITEFRQTGSRTVTGTVERDPLAVTEKAKLSLGVELATPTLSTFAVVLEDVPSKLLEAVEVAEQFFAAELGYAVKQALDSHCLAAITAAKPPSGEEGESLWIKVRNAVKAMRAKGAKPNVLALNPDDAADLDTLTAGADNLPVFALRDTGSSSPLWGLSCIEVPGLEAPTLIDTTIAGVMYLGEARFLADPFTGLDTNEVRVRIEAEALLHVRDANGIYVIEAGE